MGTGSSSFFTSDTAADVVNLGTDVLGILGIGKTAFELGKNMIGNRSWLPGNPSCSDCFQSDKDSVNFPQKAPQTPPELHAFKNRNSLFAVKVMGKCLDGLGNCQSETLPGIDEEH